VAVKPLEQRGARQLLLGHAVLRGGERVVAHVGSSAEGSASSLIGSPPGGAAPGRRRRAGRAGAPGGPGRWATEVRVARPSPASALRASWAVRPGGGPGRRP